MARRRIVLQCFAKPSEQGATGVAIHRIRRVIDVDRLGLIETLRRRTHQRAGLDEALGRPSPAEAYQLAPSSLVAALDYLYLVFALGWGWLFFGEVPDGWAIMGMVVIVFSGWLTLTR